MSPEQLAAIRERWEHGRAFSPSSVYGGDDVLAAWAEHVVSDEGALLREVDRLRAENAALRSREAEARHILVSASGGFDVDVEQVAELSDAALRTAVANALLVRNQARAWLVAHPPTNNSTAGRPD